MIKKALHITFFTFSLFLIQVHQFVPHHHDCVLPDHESPLPDWIGFLSDIVNNDLGDGHLEDFQIAKESFKPSSFSTIYLFPPALGQLSIITLSTHDATPSYFVCDFPITDKWTNKCFPLRGPPSLS
ncbi:hypothetical protein FNH22_28840 [Fulvivirga sp. M361]|uniref:hypothetical protein n=1 Tax=Fulvivirga sp. M361 TaxID=2594266 RepID=UPI001179B508|nr:hypothetical protein [Fulvivirga sp. M361]TRX48603.1 hypothetical protein FNH22_28840 [Fulvivirga sp. M361]